MKVKLLIFIKKYSNMEYIKNAGGKQEVIAKTYSFVPKYKGVH